eukprot:15657266-Heterocapsa_arctica.AAC.1
MEETLRQWFLGPDLEWRKDASAQDRPLGPRAQGAHLVARQAALEAIKESADGQHLAHAPDRLRAYAHTRLAEAASDLGGRPARRLRPGRCGAQRNGRARPGSARVAPGHRRRQSR